MQHHLPTSSAAMEQHLAASGWGPWTRELPDDAEAAAQAPLAWWGGGLSLALWACATLLALRYF